MNPLESPIVIGSLVTIAITVTLISRTLRDLVTLLEAANL